MYQPQHPAETDTRPHNMTYPTSGSSNTPSWNEMPVDVPLDYSLDAKTGGGSGSGSGGGIRQEVTPAPLPETGPSSPSPPPLPPRERRSLDRSQLITFENERNPSASFSIPAPDVVAILGDLSQPVTALHSTVDARDRTGQPSLLGQRTPISTLSASLAHGTRLSSS